ncbi:MAG: YCF48-related protein, partial [Candidatus Poribacteria bacterium]|nr:YCF48-related protein [Candidatus Poribacteria bacterium]
SGVLSNLGSVYFVDADNGWAVGANTILRTLDGGKSWRRQSFDLPLPDKIHLLQLAEVHFASPTVGWIVGTAERWMPPPQEKHEKGGVILKTTDGFRWQVQSFHPTVRGTLGVHFVDDSTGWAAAGRVMLSTMDGGQTWATQEVTDSTFINLTSVHFIDQTFGWTVGINGEGLDERGVVFRTQDGGKTWDKPEVADLPILYDVFFADTAEGWATGRSGSIFHTSDGGGSWEAQVNPIYDFRAVHLSDDGQGWAVAEGGTVLHTTDGGITWDAQVAIGTEVIDIFFIDSRHGWVVGYEGTILHTNDGGRTWIPQSSGVQGVLREVQFIDTNQGWSYGDFTLLHTRDGGRTWTSQPIGFWATTLHFVSASAGWAITRENDVLYTTDGGRIWFPQDLPTLPFGTHLKQIQFLDANNGWIVGSVLGGVIVLRTSDGGEKWELNILRPPVEAIGNAIAAFASPNEGWIVVDTKTPKVKQVIYKQLVYHTVDSGVTWAIAYERESVNNELPSVSGIHYADGVVIVVGWQGLVLRSTDAGLTIQPEKPWDVNADGIVDVRDLVRVASQFGERGSDLKGDVNGDGIVSVLDLVLVGAHFGEEITGAAAPGPGVLGLTLSSQENIAAIEQALVELERLADPSQGAVIARRFLRAWVANATPIVTETKLLPNYPNPFNPETWVPYRLAEDAFVTLTIYDMTGAVVRTIEVGHQLAAIYESKAKAIYWDGRNDSGERVASGGYFYTLTADDFVATRRMLILK